MNLSGNREQLVAALLYEWGESEIKSGAPLDAAERLTEALRSINPNDASRFQQHFYSDTIGYYNRLH